jgi:putative transposase
MTMPREIVPGATYLLSRRTSQRCFLLRPDPFVTQAFLYCLAYAATTFGIDVHAFVVLPPVKSRN